MTAPRSGPCFDALRSRNGPGGKHCSVRQQRGCHPVPGRQSHRRAGLQADSSALAPAIAPLATAAALATTDGQVALPCGDVRAVSHLSVVQDLRDIAGDRSFKHVYICFRRRLSPVAKASAKELSASYSARGSIPAASS